MARVSERRGDVVYTPAWAAEDMVRHFKPSGIILDPCRGEGIFHNLLPSGSPWCEISEGIDFFGFTEQVDWVIGNPPYSMTRKWFRHTYAIAKDFVYLIPLRNLFSGYGFLLELYGFGGIVELRLYGTGAALGFPMGNAIGAVHARRGYTGDSIVSFYSRSPIRNQQRSKQEATRQSMFDFNSEGEAA